jgi:pumilio RNA-binding family
VPAILPSIAFAEPSGHAAILPQLSHDIRLPQPVPMVWMAPMTPMTAPIQFETHLVDTGAASGVEQNSTDEMVLQPIEAWPYLEAQEWQADGSSGNGHFSVEPTFTCSNQFIGFWQQFPIPQGSGEFAVEAPSQFQMDMSTMFPSAVTDMTVMDSTLRRRSCGDHDSKGEEADTAEAWEKDETQETHEYRWVREMIAGLFAQIAQGDQGKEAAMDSFRRMSFSGKLSSRAAQEALQEAPANDAAVLVQGFRGHVRRAAQSKYANYVLQKILELMPVKRANFIIEELIGFSVEASRHPFGCRVLCRILEHVLTWEDDAIARLVDEILAHAEGLCSHEFGGFVIRHILEFGLPAHRRRVAKALRVNLTAHAKDAQGSHVVESALRFCEADDQLAIVQQLLKHQDQLLSIATHKYGRHVAKTLLSTSGELQELAKAAFWKLAPQLRDSRYGKSAFQLLKAFGNQ